MIGGYDIVIIGGGASGLATAIEAARTAKLKIAVVERMPRVGKKILATGNGRCNLSNVNATYESYFGEPEFAKYALEKYGVKDTLEFFKSTGLYTVTEDEGRIYPMSRQASAVLDALRFECERLGVSFICNTKVTSLKKEKNGFLINDDIICKKVILTAGGKSAPEQGSDGSGYELLRSMGHTITELFPALVQLKCGKEYPKQLKGVRANARVKIICDTQAAEEYGEIQFTDSGISGIAVMQLSRLVSESVIKNQGKKIVAEMDFATSVSKEELIEFIKCRKEQNEELTCENLLTGIVPKLLGQVIVKKADIAQNRTLGSLTYDEIEKTANEMKCFRLEITDTCGFKSSQVTAGGAVLSEFDEKTMQSKKINGLYAAGELLNIDGGCGGYNLQWAWSSGRLAGASAAL